MIEHILRAIEELTEPLRRYVLAGKVAGIGEAQQLRDALRTLRNGTYEWIGSVVFVYTHDREEAYELARKIPTVFSRRVRGRERVPGIHIYVTLSDEDGSGGGRGGGGGGGGGGRARTQERRDAARENRREVRIREVEVLAVARR